MFQLVVFIIFLVSLSVTGFILYKKIPVLVELPQNGHHGISKPELVKKIEKKIKEKHFHFFEKQMLLHKLLSKSKIWILRIEAKLDNWLHGIREKNQEIAKKTKRKGKV